MEHSEANWPESRALSGPGIPGRSEGDKESKHFLHEDDVEPLPELAADFPLDPSALAALADQAVTRLDRDPKP